MSGGGMNGPLQISATVDASKLATLAGFPQALEAGLVPALDRAGEEVAREMKRAAPKAFSTLTNSIRMDRDSALVRWIGSGLNYALMVERGTGPAGGQAAYFPNPQRLAPWLRQHAGLQVGSTRAGTTARRTLEAVLRDRTWALARHIATFGTKAQPFVAPTAEKMQPRVVALLAEGIDASIASLAHGGAA